MRVFIFKHIPSWGLLTSIADLTVHLTKMPEPPKLSWKDNFFERRFLSYKTSKQTKPL